MVGLNLLLLLLIGLSLCPSLLALLTGLLGGGRPSKKVGADAIPKLLALLEGTQRGCVETSSTNKADIIAAIDRIEEANVDAIVNDKNYLAKCVGNWELLWTTEKETLFFEKSGLFGSKVTQISQSISPQLVTIENLIAFENNRAFKVTGSITADLKDKATINFQFTKASLVIPPFVDVNFPPVGKGYFRNVFVSDKFRLSKDVRGDYLVSRRMKK